ncbi:hypothetical protein M409DRAFT_69854 [Zasmidium cellare ATCC 36951]|uniref:protein S-acyltransferase n=1 Tax=Zasmidium cellare ATCC 36951 TaxID=1080233 RepID=A0A6A6C4N5_ZASCE|nr:uncharacterized protein M409DRAFT_69854 [Zasmidium cellare ATCC 36951]KAF2161228.1 hypothetical protein M409DRAFT_69854 [Zasmidium cellare ATCC 36951]
MDSRGTPMGTGAPSWNDMFNETSQFEDSMHDPTFENTAFDAFTNVDAYGESPMTYAMRTPSKSGPEVSAGAGAQVSASAESSSQDSSSDTSSRRKRKTNESESPVSDPVTEVGRRNGKVKQEDTKMHMSDAHQVKSYDHFSQPMHKLSLEQSLSHGDSTMSQFDFASAASSPIQTGEFNNAMSLDTRMNMPAAAGAAHFAKASPVQTIDPGMFSMNTSRDQSPATTNMMFNQASPNAIFSTPSSDSPDTFNNQAWNAQLMNQNPAWPGDFANQLTSPGAMTFTPSPGANGGTPGVSNRGTAPPLGKSPLHIAPISTKSRVETQINVIMTLEKPPPGIEHLHLPLHTIAKSKLLAKDEFEKSKVLELHTMLVCTSAMHNSQLKEKALQKAAAANNEEIQHRAELARSTGDDEKNDPKNVEEADRPANGGEVRICTNCIQRERKRAGRKKTKREEEQQHWERFETERVVVFNSNEYLPFKPPEMQYPPREGAIPVEGEQYVPPDGSLQVSAAMRIACYCRHQSEKEGFQVIFTLKDQQGVVIAQQISDSILITDDHKTHPQSFSTAVPSESFYQTAPGFLSSNGLPMSQSMVDMAQHAQPFPSSRSAGNLQALAYGGAAFNPHSHVHQLPGSGYASQTTSATMTPTSLSRPGSPTNAGQAGPNKKRKSAQFSHRKVPSTLAMTPRVDTSQPPSSNMPSAVSMSSQFSPSTATFPNQVNQSYMTIPSNNGPAHYYNSGPSTPANENGPFNFSQPVDLSQMRTNQAYFSHPSSAVPSRAASPVQQQSRANMAAYARQQQPQQPIQTPTNSISGRPQQQMYGGHTMPGSGGHESHGPYPCITRITPREGPASGGTEVAIFGENFVMGMSVQFGDYPNLANTTFVNPNALIAIAPSGRPGPVSLTLVPPPGQTRWPKPASPTIYRYTTTSDQEEMMMAALKFLSEQHLGSVDHWQTLAQKSAASFVQSRMNPAGLHQGYPASHRMASNMDNEETILKELEMMEANGESCQPGFAANMLSLACSSGMHRVVSALLGCGASVEERDHAGFTPLMHAALHGQVEIFQLLLTRGADASVRNLKGYTAIDLAPSEVRNELICVLESTQRRRHSRPSLQTRLSYGSTASSRASWDIASASFYESEPTSRRPSTRSFIEEDIPPSIDDTAPLFPYAAMAAWRDALAAQIHHFQETLHWNMPHFQLPPLPNLTDCRRLSSLVPGKSAPSATERPHQPPLASQHQQLPLTRHHFWDFFSASSESPASAPTESSAPPAYYDIFPDRKPTQESQDDGMKSAVVDAIADEKCAAMFDGEEASYYSANHAPNKTDGAVMPSWLWVSLVRAFTNNQGDLTS